MGLSAFRPPAVIVIGDAPVAASGKPLADPKTEELGREK